MKIHLPKTLTFDACEKFIREVSACPDSSLVLPNETKGSAFGGMAAAIQAVGTWGRKSNSRQLIIKDSSRSEEDRVEEIVNKPHKFAAAMLSNSIESESENPSGWREKIYIASSSALDEQARNRFGQFHGPLCWFSFVDHSRKGLDKNFYRDSVGSTRQPRSDDQIESVIVAMVERSLKVAGRARPLTAETTKAIGRIFLELFLNTHQHGSRGELRSVWLEPAVRTIYTNGINLTKKGVEGALREEPALSAYLDGLNIDFQSGGKGRFIELSIVDSGLGYSGRWIADQEPDLKEDSLSLEEEYRIFRKCFNFRGSSTGNDEKGMGLPEVMLSLSAVKGFMRVRSGRLALFRDFNLNPYDPKESREFSDWETLRLANERISLMPRAAGVAVTLLIPLEAKS